MCIILTCEKYVRPDYELVEKCFYNNPDGAGIMWCEDGVVMTSKGYDDVQSLYGAIESVPNDSRLVIHMRIATSGGVNTGTCHPFPICDRIDALHAANVECDAAVAHNGVIHWCPTEKGISDTIYFVSNVINPLYRQYGMTKSVRRNIKRQAPGNRFAIMTNDGQVYRLGNGWETVTKGIQASNSSWRWSRKWKWSLPAASTWSYKPETSWDSWYGWEEEEEPNYFYELTPDEEDLLFDHFCGGCDSIGTCMKYGPTCDEIYDQMDMVVDEIVAAREEYDEHEAYALV